MRGTKPPTLATWILENMTPGECNEALAGDLFEGYCCGRSIGWYWRQVTAAVVIRCLGEICKHRMVLVFALVWSMLAPAWLVVIANLEERASFAERISRMYWPWPIVSDLGLLLAANLLFIWAGIVVYLIPHLLIEKSLRVRAVSRGIFASLPVLVVLWAALIVLPKRFLLQSRSFDQQVVSLFSSYSIAPLQAPSIQPVSPDDDWFANHREKRIHLRNDLRTAFADTRPSAMLVCLPFFLCVLCTLWGATSRSSRGRKGIAV